MHTADFVVIGAGIAGSSAAYRLAAHGSVIVLEQEAVPGHHTTGRSAAVFTEAFEHGMVRKLAMASRSFLSDPPHKFTETPILAPMPLMLIGRDDQVASVTSAYEDSTPAGELFRLVDGPEAEDLCPVLRPRYVAAAAYEPNSRSIDVHALHQAYLQGLRARGGTVRTKAAVTALRPQGAGWSLDTAAGRISAGVVVNAAGAWCDQIAALAGAEPVGLSPRRRTAFTFATPDGLDAEGTPMVIDADEEFYFKPEGPQFLGSLAEETPMEPHDVKPEEVDVALAIERIEAATTLTIRSVGTTWAGLRSFVADRHPVVGMDPDRPGFFWLAGQGGFGIMTSPALSQAACDLLIDGALSDGLLTHGLDATSLSPARLRK